jgi:hypothetical protein
MCLAVAYRIVELIQVNEHLHEKVEFMATILGVLHAAMAKGVGANFARSAGQLGIVLFRGAKNFSRIRNPDPRRLE